MERMQSHALGAGQMPRSSLVVLPGGHAPHLVAMDDFLARLVEHTS